jgi:sulfonate transport system permease protein
MTLLSPPLGRSFRPEETHVSASARLGVKPAIPGQRLLGPFLVLAIWYIGSGTGLISPAKLPSPELVGGTLIDLIRNGELQYNILASLSRSGLGLLFGIAAGLTLALLAGLTRLGDALFDGLVQIKRSIPNLALIPLAIIWLGIGEPMKIVIIALGVSVPIYINTHAALREIDKRYVELAETVGLSRLQFLRRIVLPGSLHGFFTGLRLAVTHAWTALVVVETINATSGVGYMMTQARIYGQTEVVLVGLVVYGTFGFLSDALVRYAERKTLSWRHRLGQ